MSKSAIVCSHMISKSCGLQVSHRLLLFHLYILRKTIMHPSKMTQTYSESKVLHMCVIASPDSKRAPTSTVQVHADNKHNADNKQHVSTFIIMYIFNISHLSLLLSLPFVLARCTLGSKGHKWGPAAHMRHMQVQPPRSAILPMPMLTEVLRTSGLLHEIAGFLCKPCTGHTLLCTWRQLLPQSCGLM
jgi:hypothetical protein